MNDKELTHDDFLQRLDIRDVLLDAGYRQNRRFGLRLSSFIRTDSEGKRIRGDKFVITQHGKCCCQPPRQKEYNVVSFIKEHPHLFAEYHEGINPDRLVELVCYRLLHYPIPEQETRTGNPHRTTPAGHPTVRHCGLQHSEVRSAGQGYAGEVCTLFREKGYRPLYAANLSPGLLSGDPTQRGRSEAHLPRLSDDVTRRCG